MGVATVMSVRAARRVGRNDVSSCSRCCSFVLHLCFVALCRRVAPLVSCRCSVLPIVALSDVRWRRRGREEKRGEAAEAEAETKKSELGARTDTATRAAHDTAQEMKNIIG